MSARIPVNFDRALQPEWIDYALARFADAPDRESHREALREHLRQEITSSEILRKTVRQLQQYTGYLSPLSRAQLLAVYEQMSGRAPTQRDPLRLRLLTASNPFFADCVAAIRNLDALGVDGVERQQIVERLIAKYGDRGTIPRSVAAALTTLARLRVLENRKRKWFVIDRSALSR